MDGPNGRIQITGGSRFYPGTIFMGFDLADWLEQRLHNQAPACEDLDLQKQIGSWKFG